MRLSDDLDSHYTTGSDYNDPHYRVSLWAGTNETWIEIHEADIDEVLEWVSANANGRGATIWARIALPRPDDEDEIVDVRLYGIDPTGFDEEFPTWAARTWPPTRQPLSARATRSSMREGG